jgi:hypothetical protein
VPRIEILSSVSSTLPLLPGVTLTIYGRFVGDTGLELDPSAVRFKLVDSARQQRVSYTAGVDAALVHVTLGRYSVGVTLTQGDPIGAWRWRWECDGLLGSGADEGIFTFHRSRVLPPA